jgi:hypothetical protein
LIVVVTGFVVPTVLFFAADGREAWDTAAYWTVGLPLFALASATAGYLAPRRVWRWPAVIAAGQTMSMILFHPAGSDLSLVPLAIAFVGLPLVLVMTVPALIAGVIARRGWASELLA